jgi:hypothetical protein
MRNHTFNHKFSVELGDWSGDGHGITATYYIDCTCESEDRQEALIQVRGAAKRAAKLRPELNPVNLCESYEDNRISAEVADGYRALGVDFDNMEGSARVYQYRMMEMIVAFINLGDPTLQARIIDDDAIDLDYFRGIGYGLFSP